MDSIPRTRTQHIDVCQYINMNGATFAHVKREQCHVIYVTSCIYINVACRFMLHCVVVVLYIRTFITNNVYVWDTCVTQMFFNNMGLWSTCTTRTWYRTTRTTHAPQRMHIH